MKSTATAADAARAVEKQVPPVPQIRHKWFAKGKSHPGTRLTEENVFEIRRRYDKGEPEKSLAKDFDMYPSYGVGIGKRRHWARLPEESDESKGAVKGSSMFRFCCMTRLGGSVPYQVTRSFSSKRCGNTSRNRITVAQSEYSTFGERP